MTDPLQPLADELAALESKGLRRRRRETTFLADGRCEIDGRSLWNFATNDYLGLAGDVRLQQAAEAAASAMGTGARASPVVTGRTEWHAELERRLARFKQGEAAILFPTGYAANVGVVAAIAGSEDVVFCDRLNHASLIDGCRLSRARFRVYPHRDVSALRAELQQAGSFRRRVIVTDSIFSMDGDAAPLVELAALAEEFDAWLIVDEAHATGVRGAQGAGLLSELGVHSPRIIAVGTLSKAVGVQGGFVAGSQILVDWLWNTARTQLFSTAMAIPTCAAAIKAIDLIEAGEDRRAWLMAQSELVARSLRAMGWQSPEDSSGPILPVLIGAPERTMQLAQQLEDLGVLVAGIRPPTVPQGTSRLRISLSFAHGEAGIQALLEAFAALGKS